MGRYAYDNDEVEVTRNVRVTTARAPRTAEGIERRARNGIRPGDRIQVTSGFTYDVGGARTGYYRTEHLLNRGPNWSPVEREAEALSARTAMGVATSGLLGEIAAFEARTGQVVRWQGYIPRERVEIEIKARAEAEAAAARKRAEIGAVMIAAVGATVTYDGREWVKVNDFTKILIHDRDMMSCTAVGAVTLRDGEGREFVLTR